MLTEPWDDLEHFESSPCPIWYIRLGDAVALAMTPLTSLLVFLTAWRWSRAPGMIIALPLALAALLAVFICLFLLLKWTMTCHAQARH